MRTAGNAIRELRDYLVSHGYEVYVQTRRTAPQTDGQGIFPAYLIITNTPANLMKKDQSLCGYKQDVRRMYITRHAIGTLRDDGQDDAADLLEEVNDLIEGTWKASDSAPISPAGSWGIDTPNTNTQVARVIHSQRYLLIKNLP
jgi:hypothetical protein